MSMMRDCQENVLYQGMSTVLLGFREGCVFVCVCVQEQEGGHAQVCLCLPLLKTKGIFFYDTARFLPGDATTSFLYKLTCITALILYSFAVLCVQAASGRDHCSAQSHHHLAAILEESSV